jgi:putative ABC transport system permease protein
MTTFRFLGTAVSLALDSIRVHKLRSFLTLLGIIIGVASVILVGAAIDGLGAYADQITSKAFGTNSFLVAQIASVGRLTYKQIVAKQKRNKRITPEDVAYLRSVTGDQVLYASYQQRIADVKSENQTYEDANIIGASATLPDIRDVPIADGRFFTETEEQYRQPVCVIGEDIRTKLFPGRSPIGGTLRLTGIDFTVVGLLEQQGSSFGQSLDNPVYIPISVYYQLFGGRDKASCSGAAGQPLALRWMARSISRGTPCAVTSTRGPARTTISMCSRPTPSVRSPIRFWESLRAWWCRLPESHSLLAALWS